MKKSFLLIVLSIFLATAFAQKSKLKGRVIDAGTNQPLAGATITLKGHGAVTTDKDGMFVIDCSKVSTLSVSFVGYETVQENIANCDRDLTITMSASGRSLNEVEITAISTPNKQLLYQPASITKLTTTELKRGNGLFLDDAINGNVPGVTMNRRAVSSGQQFNIRGYGNGSRGTRGISSNFDGQGYKLYLNGIPVTDAEGITVMDDIDFGSIGKVEVTKGPAGSLYGLAIAGAVNLETIRPEKGKTSIGQEIMIGNYGLQRYTTQFQTAGEHSSILLNYGHQESDGFTIHNASNKNFVNAVARFEPNAKQTVMAYFGYSNSYDERSGELTLGQYDTVNFTGNIEYIKRNAHSEVFTLRAGVGHTYRFNDHISNTTTIFGTSFNSNASSAGGWTDKSATNLGIRSTFDTKFTLKKGATLNGITGVETQRQNAQTIGYTMVKDPQDPNATWTFGNPRYWILGASTSNVYSTTATTSLFTEWTLGLPKDLSITAGIGMSNMKIALDDRFYVAATPNKTRRYDTTYKFRFAPHLAVNKVFSKEFSVYASFSTAYKAPVSSYFYIPYAVGQAEAGIVNSKLKPEMGTQYEVGSKGTLMQNKLVYQFAVFHAVFSDKMTTVSVPYNSSTTLFSYVTNAGKQDDKGVEGLLKYTLYSSATKFFTAITPFGNFTYSDYKYENYKFQSFTGTTLNPAIDYSGKAVAGVAKFVGNLGVDIATRPGLYANVAYFYKDGMPITSDGVYHADSYMLLNGKLGYQHRISSHFDLNAYFGANNITGVKYPIMVFVNQLPDAYIAGPIKANYFGGINLKYIF